MLMIYNTKLQLHFKTNKNIFILCLKQASLNLLKFSRNIFIMVNEHFTTENISKILVCFKLFFVHFDCVMTFCEILPPYSELLMIPSCSI